MDIAELAHASVTPSNHRRSWNSHLARGASSHAVPTVLAPSPNDRLHPVLQILGDSAAASVAAPVEVEGVMHAMHSFHDLRLRGSRLWT